MILLKKNNIIEFEGQAVVLNAEQLSKFLLANLSEKITLEDGVTIAEVMHFFYPIKDFVSNYTCEDFYAVNAVYSALSMENFQPSSGLRGRKELVISHENELIRPVLAEFELEGEPVAMFRDLELRISGEVMLKDHDGEMVVQPLKEDFIMLEFIELVFESIYNLVTQES